MIKKQTTSWGNVADWYVKLLEQGKGTYQHDVILPNLLRLLALKKNENVLDLGCGSGFFSIAFAREGAKVTGIDIAPELIALARSYADKSKIRVDYMVAPAEKISMIPDNSIDTIVSVLAIQNMAEMRAVFAESARVLKSNGRMALVLNHPAFRVPKESEWGWDEIKMAQYRRVDKYLSESKVKIEMHPGDDPAESTISFHRPLQVYMKAMHKSGFAITRLEEWISNRQGPKGRKFTASERARKEIPLFLFLEIRRYVAT